MAQPGEVLVSNTVKDLVAGSGIQFESRGTHTLKGVPGKWGLFVVTSAGAGSTDAKAIGLTIPPSFLIRANRVIK